MSISSLFPMRFPVLSLLFLFILSLSFHNPISAQCLDDQKSFLLTLFDSEVNDHLSWTPKTDCCSWEGITCDSSTGHVIGLDVTNQGISGSIPRGLESLSNLTHLNLSGNYFSGLVPIEISRMKSLVSLDLSPLYSFYFSFTNSLALPSPDFGYLIGNLTGLRELHLDGVLISAPVPEFMVELVNLSSLHLSECNLSGEFPSKIFHLRNLESLDVSHNSNLTGALPEFPLNSTSRLQIMILSETQFSGHLPDSFGNLKFLTKLDLSGGCQFDGSIPSSMAGINQLVYLDLSDNNFSGETNWLGNLTQLVHLDLSLNNFKGEIQWLGSLTRLIHLYLSNNQLGGQIHSLSNLAELGSLSFSRNRFHGQIPSLANLSRLNHLDLTSNYFSGRIPSLNSTCLISLDLSSNSFSGQIPSLPIQNISDLNLSNNSLSGRIPSSLFMIPSLETIDLHHNQLDGQLDEFHNASVALRHIYLSNNKLQGQIPRSIGELVGLSELDLSWNNFNDINLAMLKGLYYLDLSNNPLSFNSSDWNSSSFPGISNFLYLRSCNLTRFPGFLASLSDLNVLDISCNKIDGEIPNWIWTIGNGSLVHLNLSHNLATSLERPPIDTLSSKLHVIDLHSNKISGPVPPSFCNLSQIELLDLSNNNFSGTIPQCLDQMLSTLSVLNFAKNRLSGMLRQSFPDGCTLKMINLNDNQFEGSLPRSLANCKQLKVLGLGNNQIEDSFPFWLGSLPQLRILVLRSNKFYGPVEQGKDDYYFLHMQIIDLSSNGFTGKLSSKFFQSLTAMMVHEPVIQTFMLEGDVENSSIGYSYQESVKIVTKGLELEFSKALSILVSIDLSNNEFEGNIPEEIGNLKLLNVLNMSHNNFTGLIPLSFKNLSQLESLDLSVNKLSGPIPVELTSLTFLSVLNLSENHFVGSIPRGNQFLTFSANSFQENPGLCGPPLARDCHSVEPPLTSEYAYLHSENKFDWEFIGMGLSLGFGVGIWMVWGPLIFWANGRRWYFKQMDKLLIIAKAWWER